MSILEILMEMDNIYNDFIKEAEKFIKTQKGE